jgi:hypothetical protein
VTGAPLSCAATAGPGLSSLSRALDTDIHSSCDPPQLALMNAEDFGSVVNRFLGGVREIEVLLPTSLRRRLVSLDLCEMSCEAVANEVAVKGLAFSAFRAEVAVAVAGAGGKFPNLR